MAKNENYSVWQHEFSEFTSAEEIQVPAALSSVVLETVRTDLHPTAIKVFAKTSMIHAFAGAVTLLFCPQFGLSFTSSMGLMPLLMKYGESVCMFGCGALFTGISLLLASFMLRPEEVRTLNERAILQISFLATLSLGSFICLGGQLVLTLALIWALGAILGGGIALQTGWAIRRAYITGKAI